MLYAMLYDVSIHLNAHTMYAQELIVLIIIDSQLITSYSFIWCVANHF